MSNLRQKCQIKTPRPPALGSLPAASGGVGPTPPHEVENQQPPFPLKQGGLLQLLSGWGNGGESEPRKSQPKVHPPALARPSPSRKPSAYESAPAPAPSPLIEVSSESLIFRLIRMPTKNRVEKIRRHLNNGVDLDQRNLENVFSPGHPPPRGRQIRRRTGRPAAG